ncbi:MAG: hypothetical protein IPO18_01090 [bacterium]|nr:hypothetical protein [bacterium]MBK7770812.1 hypothetical protein [bacterium]MBK9470869.1 hypothetical protein [bacterium]MBK9776215.1 hypothetical protein [bacterium]
METRSTRVHAAVLAVFSVAVAVLVGWTVWNGWDYFTTGMADRPHHPDFREFRAAGRVGHGVGILGSFMIVLLLLYSLRKRMRVLQRAGQLPIWLRYHIFLGIAGPILITLHTAFKVGGLVSVSYWSMVAVALSGFFGRYLYQQIPRNVLGETLDVAEIEARNEALLVELSMNHNMDDRAATVLEDLALRKLEHRAAPMALLMLPFLNGMLVRQLQRWSLRHVDGDRAVAVRLAKDWVLQTRRLRLFHLIRDLFHYWHVFHKPFAFIMIFVMIVHVAVAVALGYVWEFGS